MGVQLRHLDALSRLLQQASSLDGLSLVAPKYGEPLGDDELAALDDSATALFRATGSSASSSPHAKHLAVLVQLTRDFAIGQLRETYLSSDASLGACLGCMELGESMLQDESWFRDATLSRVLADIKLSRALAALMALQAAQERLERPAVP
jgi:hypothetical protein